MTNEEAIRTLRRFQEPEAWEPHITAAAFEALEMAIAALEAQETDLPISPLLKEKQGKKPMKLSTVCLLCKKPVATFSTDDDIPYTNYSYCEDCLRKGLKLLKAQDVPDMNDGDMISRKAAIDAVLSVIPNDGYWNERAEEAINRLPSAQPERKKMSNKEWVDFLSEQFTVSRTSAREMLHGLMKWKAEDNFKKQYSGGRNEKG